MRNAERPALMVIVGPVGDQVDQITVGEAEFVDVRGIDEDHSAAALDAAVAIAPGRRSWC